MASTRRRTAPSTVRRPTWTTTSTALTSWACTAAGDMPASAPSASNRATTSPALLACSVPHPPSWPVLRAASSSRTSAPRASPRTSRSGRIRSAWRTRVVRVTSPAPSTLGGRASSRTTCGWSTRSSRTSSTTITRSAADASPSSAPSSVVLPTPVPPDTTNATRRRTSRRSSPPNPAGTSTAPPAPPRSSRSGPAPAASGADRRPRAAAGSRGAGHRTAARRRRRGGLVQPTPREPGQPDRQPADRLGVRPRRRPPEPARPDVHPHRTVPVDRHVA